MYYFLQDFILSEFRGQCLEWWYGNQILQKILSYVILVYLDLFRWSMLVEEGKFFLYYLFINYVVVDLVFQGFCYLFGFYGYI